MAWLGLIMRRRCSYRHNIVVMLISPGILRSSKSALHGLVHWLAGAYAKKGITVNGVAPALIEETNMLPGASAELSASESQSPNLSSTVETVVRVLIYALEIPIGRLGKPEEIAETVLWIVKVGYVNNKVIAVDGGLFIQ